jgi:hypothetical protein
MQLCIDGRLEDRITRLRKRYKEALQLLHPAPTPPAQADDPAHLTAVAHLDTDTKPAFPCSGITCTWKRRHQGSAARTSTVASTTTTCRPCSRDKKAFEMTEAVEAALRTNRPALRRIVAAAHARDRAKSFHTLSTICSETLDEARTSGGSTAPEWPLPTTSIRGQVPLNHRAAIRRLAHTLMLDMGSVIGGVDATPLPARRRAMMRYAQVTCPGSCDGTDFIRTPGGLCGDCSHLKRTGNRHTNKDTSTCPCCNERRISAVEGPSKHPCLVCTSTWLLETNPFAARLAAETATPPTPDTSTDTLPPPNREAEHNILYPPRLPRGEFMYALNFDALDQEAPSSPAVARAIQLMEERTQKKRSNTNQHLHSKKRRASAHPAPPTDGCTALTTLLAQLANANPATQFATWHPDLETATRSIWPDPATDGPHILLMHTKQGRWSLMVGQWEKGRAKHATWFDPDTNQKLAKALNRIQRELHTDARSGIDNQTPLTRIEGPTPALDAPTWTLCVCGAATAFIHRKRIWPHVPRITYKVPLLELQETAATLMRRIQQAPTRTVGNHALFSHISFHTTLARVPKRHKR